MKKTESKWIETYMKTRRDWNGVNPVTKVIQSKKAYTRKKKHKGEMYND